MVSNETKAFHSRGQKEKKREEATKYLILFPAATLIVAAHLLL